MSTKNTQVSKPRKKMCIRTIKKEKQRKKKDKKKVKKKQQQQQKKKQRQGVLNKPDIR